MDRLQSKDTVSKSPLSLPLRRSYAIPPSLAGSDSDTTTITSLDSRLSHIEKDLSLKITVLTQDLKKKDQEIEELHKYLQESREYEQLRRKQQDNLPSCIIL